MTAFFAFLQSTKLTQDFSTFFSDDETGSKTGSGLSEHPQADQVSHSSKIYSMLKCFLSWSRLLEVVCQAVV